VAYIEFMAVRLKTLFFILMLSISVFPGTPMHGGDMGMDKNDCRMKCCKESVKSQKPQKAGAEYLCRVLGCSQDMPTNTTKVARLNLAPVFIASEKESLFEILFSTTPKEEIQPKMFQTKRLINSQPKYIQHQRILV